MSLYERLRGRADHVWRRIMEHPFVVELYRGTLPLEKFRYYILQDYNFLVAMTRVFSIMASRASPRHARVFLELARAEATTEMEAYERLLERLGLSLEDALAAEPSPTNTGYTSWLIATCSLGDNADCLAAILPCYASYREIALHHQEALRENPVQLYREWASTYLTREYAELVEKLKTLLEEVGQRADPGRLEKIFLTASRYEYMFWDMAYRAEEWPV